MDDIFAVQEEVTQGIVAAVAPEVELSEVAKAGRTSPNDTAVQLIWRAQGLLNEGVRKGRPEIVLNATATVQRAIAADPTALAAYNVVAWANLTCHLYRWGPDPAGARGVMWSAIEQMQQIDALDHRTLTISGVWRVIHGEQDRGLADLRRAIAVNPNSSLSLMWLALCEAMSGLGLEAREHAMLSLRLNPRDIWIGVAHVALSMVSFAARDYDEAARWSELAIQSEPAAPLRRVIMIACCARLGDLERAARERAILNGFAPDFIPSLLRGEFKAFTWPADKDHLFDSLLLAG